MVYCTKCGTKNSDDAVVCVKCGERLRAYAERPRRYKYEREEMCFGRRTGAFWGIILGFVIVLVGLFYLLQQAGYIPTTLEIWPLIVIAFGVIILVGVLTRYGR